MADVGWAPRFLLRWSNPVLSTSLGGGMKAKLPEEDMVARVAQIGDTCSSYTPGRHQVNITRNMHYKSNPNTES